MNFWSTYSYSKGWKDVAICSPARPNINTRGGFREYFSAERIFQTLAWKKPIWNVACLKARRYIKKLAILSWCVSILLDFVVTRSQTFRKCISKWQFCLPFAVLQMGILFIYWKNVDWIFANVFYLQIEKHFAFSILEKQMIKVLR